MAFKNTEHLFYGVIILSSVIGIALDFAHVSPMRALFGAAIVNGLLDPFLLVGILIVASDQKHAWSVGCDAISKEGAAIIS